VDVEQNVNKQKILEQFGTLLVKTTPNSEFPFIARMISPTTGHLAFTRGGATEKDALDRLYCSIREYLWNTTQGRL